MFIEFILMALAAGVAGSGAIRVLDAKERHANAVGEYERILKCIEDIKLRLEAQLEKLGQLTDVAFERLRNANNILQPLARVKYRRMPPKCTLGSVDILTRSTDLASDYLEVKAAAGGTMIGAGLAVGSWTAVSILGTASTGTAIGGLHGVAATNAALAWFGGGSLATGGGGMIAGKLALVNVIFLPVAVIGGVVAHMKATDISEKVRELESANLQNTNLSTELGLRERSIAPLLSDVANRTESLSADVAWAQSCLFRFGIFSRIYKYCRYLVRGNYYSAEEMVEVEALANSVDRFISAFGRRERGNPGQGPEHLHTLARY